MKELILKGKSLKGKNRIREHGEVWNVVREEDRQFLIESKDKKDLRWISKQQDTHFEHRPNSNEDHSC